MKKAEIKQEAEIKAIDVFGTENAKITRRCDYIDGFISGAEWMQSQQPDVREVLMEFFIMLNKNDMIKNLYAHPKHYVDHYLSTLPDNNKEG